MVSETLVSRSCLAMVLRALHREKEIEKIRHWAVYGQGLTPLKKLPRKQKLNGIVIMLVIGLAVVTGLIWMQRETAVDGNHTLARSVTSPSAFDHYLEAQSVMDRWDKGDNLDKAIELFSEAAELYPEFALAPENIMIIDRSSPHRHHQGYIAIKPYN